PNTPVTSLNQPVKLFPSWSDTTTGRRLYFASNPAAGSSNVYRVNTVTWAIETTFTATAPFGPTSLPSSVLYVGDGVGFMHGLPATGTAAQFTVEQAGFPFRDAAGVNQAIRGGPGWDSGQNRLIFGNAAGNVYTLNTSQYAGAWTLNTNYFMTSTLNVPIASIPLVAGNLIYVTNTQGALFIIDAFRGPAATPRQQLVYTYNFGSPVLSDLSRDADPSSGRIYVSTGNGKLYAVNLEADPTPGSP
ncbi:MAG: hypothetical protein JO332_00985, partial [Planctomycetaceae bacterium]|nr:hypothetical protein [Planctomycetaceae bacterium]